MKKQERFIYDALNDKNLTISRSFKNQLRNQLFAAKEGTDMAKDHKQLTFSQLFRQRKVAYAGGFALLLVVATTAYALDNRNQSLARQNIIEDTVEIPQNLDGLLGIDEMRTLAQNDAPDGSTIVGVEVENEHGKVLYKVKFSDGSFRLYDAVTGLAFIDTTEGVETSESVPAGFVAGITVQQARDTAAAQRPGKTITKIELEVENGVVVYSVRFADGGRVDVNATDSSVVRVRGADGEKVSGSDDDSSDDSSNDDSSSHDSDDDNGSDDSDDNSGSGSGNSGSGSNHSEDD
ncbi:PepSY domain-containing protein [Candidatus Saccharibacteria bacterium]|nr:PepSY domain-containing protein [Candidatus Saccharibacteria bacterium]